MPDAHILLFGATGSLGRHTLESLVDRGISPGTVTAAGRNRQRLDELSSAGFGTAGVDLSDSALVAELVAAHTDIVLISGSDSERLAQHRSVIDAAEHGQVGHVYYTSGVRADDTRFAINADHKATEDALIASGVTYTILRNTWYIENYLQSLPGPRHTGILAAAAGEAVVAAASRKDLADALAAVVTTGGHDNVTYSLSGDTDFTYTDIADAMSVLLERDVTYQSVTPEELHDILTQSGMDPEFAGFLVDLDQTIAAGAFARVGDNLTRLIGRPTTGLVDGLATESS